MAEDVHAAEAAGEPGTGPAGPFLREYPPTGGHPQVSAQRASVLFYRNGGYSVVTVSGTRHVDKRALARPYNVCEIALGTYQTRLRMDLPAAGGTTFFKAEVDIHWSVTDPHLAAVEVVTDVGRRLTAPVLERLREVTSTYRVTEAEQADRALTRECAGGRWDSLGAELGLRVRLYVRLRVDDRTIEHSAEIRDARASAELTGVRQDAFRAMLRGGDLEQLSFMLAADPERAKDFLEQIRQEGRQDERERVERLFDMVASGQIQSNDVETQALNLLNQGRGRPIQGPIGSVPARRETARLEPARPEPFTPDWVAEEPPYRAGTGADEDAEDLPPRARRRSRDGGWDWAEEDR